ncbi:excalibur calcium-binding domain-containing protein [Streptomyces sp. SID14515]|uniref:excalibur calcium-binding domain-containing protein n=1 Tax=Streptomyces sp. SID14515 TaxID=2706074 RepID=UPI0013C7E17F|nr:excalibur calcium-binding domain-containing protein [Streptomyces sp. SID14515]NEB42461.1 excalibur calcium-binding domain-containing protein [Streptomyces sp. SID14515]
MQTRKQSRRPRRGILRIRTAAGAGALALILTGCGSDDGSADGLGGQGAAEVAASGSSSAPVKRALALMDDDEQSVDAGDSLDVDVLDNDSVTLESGAGAALLDAYDAAELSLDIDTAPGHGSASVSGTTVTYTARDGYAGEDELTYRVLVKGTKVPAATAVVRITVTAPAPEPTPTPASASASGTGSASGTESTSGTDSDSGSGSGSGSGGGGSTSYANCTAVRNAGAAPIRAGDPGYGRHLDRDGDGVGCE